MTSSFFKKVLIEQAELDRLYKRQLREHLPELQAMVRLLNNMRDITANKKFTAEERLNSISGPQIQFDKLKKETGLLNNANPPQVALEALPAARRISPKVLENKGIGPEIEQDEEEQEEQYENVLAKALSPQMARVIRWNVHGLY